MQNMITILGPTASGKTSLAAALAADIDAEIISADSRQVYRCMDIGTGKDLEDYNVNNKHINYHLIDIVEPGTKYNLFEYQQDFFDAYNDVVSRKKIPILCGGSGLYIEAVLNGYNLVAVPENRILRDTLESKSLDELTEILIQLKKDNGSNMHNSTDVDNKKRAIRAIEIETYYKTNSQVKECHYPKIKSTIFGIDIGREERRRRISERLKQRLNSGMIEEVKVLLEKGVTPQDLIYYGLEYKFVTKYIIGEISYEEMFRSLEIAIHQFAKRQMTWFRGMERRGFIINWIDYSLPLEEKIKYIKTVCNG
ncbi:tRNA (adenosine(37)-N6)-dimethylallyltransferase MiaA [Prevotella sp.]|uniref:tRNA (adenosine(37)-N6)-dimethylallyltransferase MiaA n=1 Tax=Prevotella sp. TaxID=59823 RepID=UPI003AB29852